MIGNISSICFKKRSQREEEPEGVIYMKYYTLLYVYYDEVHFGSWGCTFQNEKKIQSSSIWNPPPLLGQLRHSFSAQVVITWNSVCKMIFLQEYRAVLKKKHYS